MINWEKAKIDDYKKAKVVIEKAIKEKFFSPSDFQALQMDLVATHISGCPLDFQKMSEGEMGDILHDLVGINKNLDRDSGELLNCFLPRFALN